MVLCEDDFETWEDTVERYSEHIEKLKLNAINLISMHLENGRKVIVTNSTGKDSMVVSDLVSKILNKDSYDTYFNVTTLDVADSNLMAKRLNFKFTLPQIETYGGFYQYIKKDNIIPTRLNRCCCRIFKEEATVESFPDDEKILFLFGMRNDESQNRANYEDVWVNEKWGKRDWIGLLPIRTWTELDVWLYTLKENCRINDKYRKGYSRVGCGIACPNYSKTTWVLDKYWYPTMYKRWRDILEKDFIDNNKWLIMNCTLWEYIHICWNGGVYRDEPTAEVIEEFAKYNNLDVAIAEKYFNRYCANGCTNTKKKPLKIKNKDVLAMNLKLHGRTTNKIYCKKCLMKELNMSKEEWDSNVAEKYYYDKPFEFHGDDKKIIATLQVNSMDMSKRVYNRIFKCGTLTCISGGYQEKKVWDNGRVRKLTEIEYERLQTLPDNYTGGCGLSYTARCSLCGNGWTKDVIKHIFKGLIENT